MTLEDLKIEAKKHGYRLEKIPERIVLLPCPICGKKRTSTWYSPYGRIVQCSSCDGFRGGYGRNEREAKLRWNEAVKAAKGE
jgi:hypothetical protein